MTPAAKAAMADFVSTIKQHVAQEIAPVKKELEELQHRTKRLSEHCAGLETKVQALERK